MTRARRQTATTQAGVAAPRVQHIGNANTQVLFQYGNWIGLKAQNQWGFDILNLSGEYHQSLIAAKDFDALMQCFALYLKQTGKLGNVTGSAAVARNAGVARNNGATRVRGNRRTSITQSQTPALATSGV